MMKLGRNPIELIVLEPLEGVPEPNLDHDKQTNKIKTKKSKQNQSKAKKTRLRLSNPRNIRVDLV